LPEARRFDNMIGIVGYGTYIPTFRIKLSDIAEVWKKESKDILAGLKVQEKSVPSIDEDCITLAVTAGKRAIDMAGISAENLGCVYFGSESHPYAVKPSSTTVAEYLGVGNNYMAADLEFACKAATAGIQVTLGLIQSKQVRYGMVIGSDTAQGRPHDALEYTTASAAVAFILGTREQDIVAEILHTSSFTSDTPDFWRRDGQKYPMHFGRFTGEPAYFTHVISEGRKLLESSKTKSSDYDFCVLHMPNGKFPRIAAKKLGFTEEQLLPSLTVENVGNSYSASALIGLSAVLDIAKPNKRIFFVSYGSGAGSDGFVFRTTQGLIKKRNKIPTITQQIKKKQYITYAQYLKQTHVI